MKDTGLKPREIQELPADWVNDFILIRELIKARQTEEAKNFNV